MNPMTPPGPPVNSVYVVAPPNGYPVVPGTVTQVPLYPGNQPQIHVIPGNPPGLVTAQKVLKNGKVLGAIQILIGLVHIGMGSIMITNLSGYYIPVSLYGGFPFWGGVWFIISGSLSVAAENQPNSSCLLNGSVGLNIFSAICSAVGIILLITDMSISGTYVYPNDYPYYYYSSTTIGMALSGVLLIFCILELSIASVSSHFGCQVACCQSNNVDVVIPNVYTTNPVVFPEPSNPIPSYSSAVQDSNR
ncbi:membrane-spanning 4-domains subfamily A member 8 [Peromyscus maniculatus bairdii]|uniref:membrane-spanning 4-domains subfamily A member 8 n=1 Tax=Peromyscus maniculatus bairdii TaxID=230844 RepID=UPI00042AA341